MLVIVFNAEDTADLSVEEILKAGSFDMGAKAERIEDPSAWTDELIKKKHLNLMQLKEKTGILTIRLNPC